MVTEEQKEALEAEKQFRLDVQIALADTETLADMKALKLTEFEQGFLQGRKSVLRRLNVDEIIKRAY